MLRRPERFGALHFFNPPNRMRLVETAVAPQTSAETSARLDEVALSLGKTPVRVAATPAFAVNRVLMPLLNEAVRELEEGVAPAESIDDAVRLGLNHPMGPLALADLIGLDVVLEIMGNLAERTGDETYEPRPMLRRLVAEGKLGRKTGEGFYVYETRPDHRVETLHKRTSLASDRKGRPGGRPLNALVPPGEFESPSPP